MSEPDLSLICRIALEESEGGLLMDAVLNVCQRCYPEQADALFRRLVAAIEARMAEGLRPDEAVAAIADAFEPEPARRPWWRLWGR